MEPIKTVRGLIYDRYKNEAEFGRAIGWPRQRVNKITNGNRQPTIEELETMAIGLDVPTSVLLEFFLHKESPNGQLKTGQKGA